MSAGALGLILCLELGVLIRRAEQGIAILQGYDLFCTNSICAPLVLHTHTHKVTKRLSQKIMFVRACYLTPVDAVQSLMQRAAAIIFLWC